MAETASCRATAGAPGPCSRPPAFLSDCNPMVKEWQWRWRPSALLVQQQTQLLNPRPLCLLVGAREELPEGTGDGRPASPASQERPARPPRVPRTLQPFPLPRDLSPMPGSASERGWLGGRSSSGVLEMVPRDVGQLAVPVNPTKALVGGVGTVSSCQIVTGITSHRHIKDESINCHCSYFYYLCPFRAFWNLLPPPSPT